jgi:hypothetical protein
MMTAVIRLEHQGTAVSSTAGSVTFGRSSSCDLRVGGGDQSVSRVAGSVTLRDDVWWLTNQSASRPLYLVSPVGLRSVLAVKDETALGVSTRVLLVGSLTYEVEVIAGSSPDDDPVELPERPGEAQTSMPTITPLELTSLVALAEGYFLAHPRYVPQPRTYAEAAQRLSLPTSTVRKRAENVRRKLVNAGVLGVESGDSRQALIEFAIGAGLIGPGDLELLSRPDDG